MSESRAGRQQVDMLILAARLDLEADGVALSDEQWEEWAAGLRRQLVHSSRREQRSRIVQSWMHRVVRLHSRQEEEQERLREEAQAREHLVHGQISQSHYIRVGDFGNPAVAAAAAALSDLLADNVPLAVVAAIATEIAQRYKHLSEDEGAVLDVLRHLARGGSIYKMWIEEDELLAAMDPALDMEDRRRLLANMKSRGILEEGAGKWRAVW